ncbi:MAG: PIG-L family deacetylase [Bacteroidota bacterium]
MNNVKNILVLAPHPDDAEFGSGACLHRWNKEGKHIFIATFSPCKKSLPEGQKDVLYDEMSESLGKLGLDPNNVKHFDFPVREFPKYRQEILEELILLRKEINPDLILVPASFDIHQDHQIIHQEGLRAFKNRKVLGYELPWNTISSTINYRVKVEEQDLKAKESAAACYSSQSHRTYTQSGFFKSLATIRGVQSGTEYAEGFELIVWNED